MKKYLKPVTEVSKTYTLDLCQTITASDDGTTIPPYAPHLHMYDESCAHENKCHNAILLPEHFKNPNDCIRLMEDFLKSINVVDVEHLQIFQQGGLDYE